MNDGTESKQNPPSRHHFIPIFYTKWWAGADGLVERFTKPHGRVVDRRVAPSRCGWAADLYRIPHVQGTHAQALEEHYFKQLDDVAAKALRKMNSPGTFELSIADANAWTTFIMSLLHRSPEYLRDTKRLSYSIWESTLPKLRNRYDELRSDRDPLTFEEYVTTHEPEEVHATLMWSVPHLIQNKGIGDFLMTMNWALFNVPAGCHALLLSDNPLARTNGIKTPGGHVAMPLSPRRLLVGAWEVATLKKLYQIPIRKTVAAMNKWTVESAQHFVVASDLSQLRFIANRFGTDPKASINRNTRAEDVPEPA